MATTLKANGTMSETDARRIMVKAEKAAMKVRQASVNAATTAYWTDRNLEVRNAAIDAATETYNAAIKQARREYDEALGPWEAI